MKVQLRTGPNGLAMFDLDAPDWSLLTTGVVANNLAAQCRYNGNHSEVDSNSHYSVAQHAVLTALLCYRTGGTRKAVSACLHHDDVEAITGDIVTPIKQWVPELRDRITILEQSYFNYRGEGYELLRDKVNRHDQAMFLIESSIFFANDSCEHEPIPDDMYDDAVKAMRSHDPIVSWSPLDAARAYESAVHIVDSDCNHDVDDLVELVGKVNSVSSMREQDMRNLELKMTQPDIPGSDTLHALFDGLNSDE